MHASRAGRASDLRTNRDHTPTHARRSRGAHAAGPCGAHAARRRPSPRPALRFLALACAVTFTFVALGGPAFGYFTALSGSGTAQQSTGTLQGVAILAATTGSPSSSLLPGDSADLLLKVTNPNPTTVTIIAVSQGGGVSVQGGSGCTGDPAWPGTLGNSGVSVASSTGLSIPVAGVATAEVHVAAGAAMGVTSYSGCQGASFQVPVTVVVSQ